MSKSKKDRQGGHMRHELEAGGGVVVWTRAGRRFGKRYKNRLFRRSGRETVRGILGEIEEQAREDRMTYFNFDYDPEWIDWDTEDDWDYLHPEPEPEYEESYDDYYDYDDRDYYEAGYEDYAYHSSYCPTCGRRHHD